MAVPPRHVICALGAWTSLDGLAAAVLRAGGASFALDRERSRLAADPRMPAEFEASEERIAPSITEEDWRGIEAHSAVAYVLSPPLPARDARAISAKTLAVVDALFTAGASAVKSESAGLAHGSDTWKRLSEMSRSPDPIRRAVALVHAWVRRPIVDERVYATCGLHLLGEPDVEIGLDVGEPDALEWIDALAVYLVTEKPVSGVHDGETFRRTASDPPRTLRSRACDRYREDDLSFNPYGYLRIE